MTVHRLQTGLYAADKHLKKDAEFLQAVIDMEVLGVKHWKDEAQKLLNKLAASRTTTETEEEEEGQEVLLLECKLKAECKEGREEEGDERGTKRKIMEDK